uniref:Transmembrane protein 44 n=1 Tax=Echeneis naucrates TaxID=173247 RepID=A0A665UTC2_ECHNA
MLNGGTSVRNMEALPTGRGTGGFLADLLAFCSDSAASCLSGGADRLCAPAVLSSVSALVLLLSCPVLLQQKCRSREKPWEGSAIFFYCFLGNLCGAVGALLSRQLYIQILMAALAAAVDAVNFQSSLFLLILCWNSKSERRLRMIRRRRRQRLLAICVLMVIAGGFLKSTFSHDPADRPLRGRTLLHVDLQDNTEILGYILGVISFVIAFSSRFPAVCRAYRGQTLTPAQVLSGLLCSLSGALYATAILFYDTQLGFLLRVLPWLLSAISCVTLDLLILVLHWSRRETRRHPLRFSPDTERLLTEEETVGKKHDKQKLHSSTEANIKNTLKTEIGPYMDVSVHPARKICLKEETLSKGEVEDRSHNWTVRVIRNNSLCPSDTSCESSLFSSDLEWDFEHAQWREPTAKQQQGEEFPLQEWPENARPFNFCACAVSAPSQKPTW